MKALNVEDVNIKLTSIVNDLTEGKKDVDIAKLKEANNAMKTLILNNSKKLVYNQFMKQAKKIDYFDG